MAERVGDQGGHRPAGASGDPLERRAANVEARLRQLMAAQARGRWQLLLVVVVIVVMFAIFTVTTTGRVRENFQADKVREAVVATMPDVRPELERHLRDVAADVLPVYREQAVARFRDVGPQVADAAIERLKQMPQTSAKQLEDHLRASHERVLAKFEPELKKRYPSLTDEQKKLLLAGYFHDKVEAENAKLAAKINAMHTNEAIRVQAVLEKFGVGADETPAQPGERERQFLHALVDVMVDSQIAGYELRQARPAAAAPLAPAEPAAGATTQQSASAR